MYIKKYFDTLKTITVTINIDWLEINSTDYSNPTCEALVFLYNVICGELKFKLFLLHIVDLLNIKFGVLIIVYQYNSLVSIYMLYMYCLDIQ